MPPPSSLDTLRGNPAYAGWVLGLVDLDRSLFEDAIERVNITLPRRVLNRLDAQAKAAGDTRSGHIARMTLETRRGSP